MIRLSPDTEPLFNVDIIINRYRNQKIEITFYFYEKWFNVKHNIVWCLLLLFAQVPAACVFYFCPFLFSL